MNNLLTFPMNKERTDRLNSLSSSITINFSKEEIKGDDSYLFSAAMAYGNTSVMDMQGSHVRFDSNFVEKIQKIRVKTKVKKECLKLNKSLKKLSFNKNKYNYNLIFDDIDVDCSFFSEDFYINASVAFPEKQDSLSIEKDEYDVIKEDLAFLQHQADQMITEFIIKVEQIFYSKKNKTNEFNDMVLELYVA